MDYLIGDLQGCCGALDRLLRHIDFSPSRDRLHLLGDLVNRGPDSLGTLRRLQTLGGSAVCLLGNHDLHLLAVAHGTRKPSRGDTLAALLEAPDRPALLDWLRHQRLALYEHGWLMVHAGVVPQWDLDLTLSLAGEVEQCLRGPNVAGFLAVMYGNAPARWDPSLTGDGRLRFAVNVLTRIRHCAADGTLDLSSKDGTSEPPEGLYRWFDAPGRQTQGIPVAFGHWSTLGLINRPGLLSLDTGCVWGGRLSAARLPSNGALPEILQVDCDQAQRPA